MHLLLRLFASTIVCCLLVFTFQNCGKSFVSTTTLSSLSIGDVPGTCVIADAPPLNLNSSCYTQILQKTHLEFANFQTYEPQYPLWNDGADKMRWIHLPRDSQINTTNMEEWVYPVGTVTFKEFAINGRKVETRMLEKISLDPNPSNAWRMSTYVWNTAQTEAHRTVDGTAPRDNTAYEFESAGYRVPSLGQCITCHSGSRDFLLGFNALQLSDATKPGHLGHWRLNNFLSNAPNAPITIPGSALDKATIGYLTTNCGSCHNPRGVASDRNINFLFNYSAVSVQQSNTYVTTVGVNDLVNAGSAVTSRIYQRVQGHTMPPRSVVTQSDPMAVNLLSDWINSLVSTQ